MKFENLKPRNLKKKQKNLIFSIRMKLVEGLFIKNVIIQVYKMLQSL